MPEKPDLTNHPVPGGVFCSPSPFQIHSDTRFPTTAKGVSLGLLKMAPSSQPCRATYLGNPLTRRLKLRTRMLCSGAGFRGNIDEPINNFTHLLNLWNYTVPAPLLIVPFILYTEHHVNCTCMFFSCSISFLSIRKM